MVVDEQEFEADAANVRRARSFVVSVLHAADREVPDLLSLLVSELATNAVVHARSRFCVSVRFDGDVVRVEVADESPVMPVPQTPDANSITGRGLRLIADIADAWGAEPAAGGKVVWFEIDASPLDVAQEGTG